MNVTASDLGIEQLRREHVRAPADSFDSSLLWRAESSLLRWMIALVVTGASIAVAVSLRMATGADNLLIVFAGVLVVAWFADTRTALFVVLVTSITAAILVFDPVFSPNVETVSDVVRLGVFVTMAPLTVFTIARIRGIERDRDALVEKTLRLNGDLAAANDAKDEFLSLVSHELKSPLAAIAADAHVLARDESISAIASARSSVLEIERRATGLGQVIDDLLTLARLERGQVLPVEPTIVAREVERILSQGHLVKGQREVTFVDQSYGALADGSPTYIERVVTNLVTNADKYSPPAEAIDVRVERSDRDVTVRVLDRGSGVSAEERAKIFQPFYRSSATSASAPGAGVGLTVCKRLAEAQGGEIWVEGRPGGGAVFAFRLPSAVLD
jgi:K+-sensing histidine kinase KdpD